MFNILYFDMVSYAVGLCIFMTTVVILMLFLLVWGIGGVIEVQSESSFLELVWTVIPTIWVLLLCVLKVGIIIKDVENNVGSTMKIVGRQWYWSYIYGEAEYDSYMVQLMKKVDNPLQMKYGVSTRLLMTSSDVIHSFSVPDLGIKTDAMPGRVNQYIYTPDRVGSFVGYCSELCGTGHSYMPIVVEVVLV